MDQVRLQDAALTLERLLAERGEGDSEVADLRRALDELIRDAATGRIVRPLEWRDVPGEWAFSEGSLRRERDLELAYSNFKTEITGGETDALRWLRSKMNDA